MSAVNDKVKQIVAQQFGIEASKISDNASFADDLEADSLDRVELIMALEEAFDIQIPDGDVEKITTVEGVINYIEKNAKITKQ